jgi:hypothetical protein
VLFYREPATAALVELDDEGRYRQAVKRFASIGFAHDCDHVRAHLSLAGDKPLDPDARFIKKPRDVAAAVVRMLHHTPLMSDGALVPDVTLTKDNLAEFVDALLRERAIVENVLRLDVRADVCEKPITSLNAVLRVIGLRVRNTRRRRVNGQIVREYGLDRAAYDSMMRTVERRRATDGWSAVYEMHGWDLLNELEGEDPATTEFINRICRQHPTGQRETARA